MSKKVESLIRFYNFWESLYIHSHFYEKERIGFMPLIISMLSLLLLILPLSIIWSAWWLYCLWLHSSLFREKSCASREFSNNGKSWSTDGIKLSATYKQELRRMWIINSNNFFLDMAFLLMLEKYHLILPYRNFSLLNISQKHKVAYSLSWSTTNMGLFL